MNHHIEKKEIRKRIHKRIRRKLRGTTERPRLAVYRSVTHIYAQIIDDTQGKTLVSASSVDKNANLEAVVPEKPAEKPAAAAEPAPPPKAAAPEKEGKEGKEKGGKEKGGKDKGAKEAAEKAPTEKAAKVEKPAAKPLKARGGNIAGARAIGKLVAERAKEKGIKRVVFDRGGYQYHGRIKALADAARAAGLEF